MKRWFASCDIDEIDSIGGFDNPVNRPLHFLNGHVINPIRTIVGKADRTLKVTDIGNGDHGKLARCPMPGTRSAIKRTTVSYWIGSFDGRTVRMGLKNSLEIPVFVIRN
jgi:hypothetical protein